MSSLCEIKGRTIGKKIAYVSSILVLLLVLAPFISFAENQPAIVPGETAVAVESSAGVTDTVQEDEEYVIIPDEPIPAAPAETGQTEATSVKEQTPKEQLVIPDSLPQTGGVSPTLFFSIGSLISASGLLLKRMENKK